MEQVAPVKAGVSKSRVVWTDIALVALLIVLLTFVGGELVVWSARALLGAPVAVFSTLALFLLPGLALVRLLWPDSLAPTERWSLAVGCSVALVPVVVLLSSIIGLRWNTPLGWAFLALCLGVTVWPRRGEQRRIRSFGEVAHIGRPHAILLVLTFLAIVVRLYVVRDLPAGMFGDSYHHTVIVQLMVDHGGLFSSWEPYAPLTTFTYHYGFHSFVAWFSILSGFPATQSLLIIGQLENALAVPLVYLFTKRVLGSEAAGLWAAAIVGFVSPMPVYYVNWGRYTQLGGQLILPAACVLWVALLNSVTADKPSRLSLVRLGALTAIVTAGLIATHYRVAVFAACFVAMYGVYLVCTSLRSPKRLMLLAGVGVAVAGISVVLMLPWLLRLREGALLRIGGQFISRNIGTDYTNILPSAETLLSFYTRPYLAALSALGVVLLMWRRTWVGLTLLLWAAAVFLAANPFILGLPGAGILTNQAVYIAVYLIIAPLAGAALAILSELVGRWVRMPQLVTSLAVAAGVVVVVWGVNWQRNILDRRFQVFTPADEAAVAWIRRELPQDATIYVNNFPAYGSLYAGSDGGWWLPLLTQRRTNLPPITYGSEAGEKPGAIQAVGAINKRINTLLQQQPNAPETATALREAGFEYLYDGKAASILDPSIHEFITPQALADAADFTVVYQQDGVTIWKVR